MDRPSFFHGDSGSSFLRRPCAGGSGGARPAFIDQIDHSVAGLRFQQLQFHFLPAAFKKPDTVFQKCGDHGDVVAVDQIRPHQLLNDAGTAADPDAFSGFRSQLLHQLRRVCFRKPNGV